MTDGIRVNMTSKEASSESRDAELLPAGKYLMAVTDVDLREVTNPPKPGKQDNRGKPFYAFEFTVQGGDYEGRKVWTNAMLFSPALYTVVNMLKALGVPFSGSDDNPTFQVPGYEPNTIPGADWWLGKQMVVRTTVKKGGLKEKGSEERYADRAEPAGFFSADSWDPAKAPTKAKAAASASNSLLP